MFVSPLTDFQVNGFLSLGNIAIPTANGKKAGSLCVCGKKKLIRLHLDAINRFMTEPEKYFSQELIPAEKDQSSSEKNSSDSEKTRTFRKKPGLFL